MPVVILNKLGLLAVLLSSLPEGLRACDELTDAFEPCLELAFELGLLTASSDICLSGGGGAAFFQR